MIVEPKIGQHLNKIEKIRERYKIKGNFNQNLNVVYSLRNFHTSRHHSPKTESIRKLIKLYKLHPGSYCHSFPASRPYSEAAMDITSISKFYRNRLLACCTSLPRGPETLLSRLPYLRQKVPVLGAHENCPHPSLSEIGFGGFVLVILILNVS